MIVHDHKVDEGPFNCGFGEVCGLRAALEGSARGKRRPEVLGDPPSGGKYSHCGHLQAGREPW